MIALEAPATPETLAARLFQSAIGALDLATIYIGDRLGLYQTLAEAGPATPAALAAAAGADERYVREWLEQQAVTGILAVDAAEAPACQRRYSLPPAHAEVLLDRDSLNYMAPLARGILGTLRTLPTLLQMFRVGAGIPYDRYDVDVREGIAEGNRTLFINLLGSVWLPSVPDIHARLQADPPARVADVGCGCGWSSIAIARAYPNARVYGIDKDVASVAQARAHAAAEGIAGRVTFHLGDAAEADLDGPFDLITAFECVHDMARPVEALRAMRAVLAPGGIVLIADERTAETFTAPGDDLERMLYGFSVLHCLPVGLAETPSAGTGTLMRPDTLRGYATEAGFRAVDILPIEHDLWRFYRLRP
jgi:2-polyprenyl-3-methyl-5-hydroxy-6-metoxy-1,4-benzoquinol methylase